MHDNENTYDEAVDDGELLEVVAFNPAMSFDEDEEDLVIEQLSVVCRVEYLDEDGDSRIGWFDAVLNDRGLHFDGPLFDLAPVRASRVRAPLLGRCHANLECRLHDDALVEHYNFFVFEVVKAHVAVSPRHPRTLHYTGDGVFMTAGRMISRRSLFRPDMLG